MWLGQTVLLQFHSQSCQVRLPERVHFLQHLRNCRSTLSGLLQDPSVTRYLGLQPLADEYQPSSLLRVVQRIQGRQMEQKHPPSSLAHLLIRLLLQPPLLQCLLLQFLLLLLLWLQCPLAHHLLQRYRRCLMLHHLHRRRHRHHLEYWIYQIHHHPHPYRQRLSRSLKRRARS